MGMDRLLGEWVMVVRFFFKEINGYLIFGVVWVVRRIDDGSWVDAWGWTGCWVNGLWWFDFFLKKSEWIFDFWGWVGG